MSDIESVIGRIEIQKDNWIWIPDNLKKQNVSQLAKDLRFVSRVNPATGITFRRHLKNAEGCFAYLSDSDRYSKCVIELNKL